METLRSNVNTSVNHPNKETMELFLEIWNKSKLFNQTLRDSDWNLQYKNVNAIITLAVISDYLSLPDKQQEKQLFLEELEKSDESFYKKMWEFALNIWESKWNLSSFSQSMIDSDRKRLQEIDSDIRCFPIIVDKENFPKRIYNINRKSMIHKKFEAELNRLNWIKDWADRIQAESANHSFNRWDNSKEINDLESKL